MGKPRVLSDAEKRKYFIGLLCTCRNWYCDVVQTNEMRTFDALGEAEMLNDLESEPNVLLIDLSKPPSTEASAEYRPPVEYSEETKQRLREVGERLIERPSISGVVLDMGSARLEADGILCRYPDDMIARPSAFGSVWRHRQSTISSALLREGWTLNEEVFTSADKRIEIQMVEEPGPFGVGMLTTPEGESVLKFKAAWSLRQLARCKNRIRQYLHGVADTAWLDRFFADELTLDDITSLYDQNPEASRLLMKGMFPYCLFRGENGRLHGSI